MNAKPFDVPGKGRRVAAAIATFGGAAAFAMASFVAGDHAPHLASLGVVFFFLAAVLAFPSMLLDGDGVSVSSMRVVLLFTVAAFAALVMGAGWSARTMADVKIDPWWTTLLTALTAAKAAQSVVEGKTGTANPDAEAPPNAPPAAPPPAHARAAASTSKAAA